MNGPDGQQLLDPLTDREIEVLHLISDGMSNREIAQQLIITHETVKWYNKQIYSKLDVHSRTEAVAQANQLGLFDEHPDTPAPASPHHNLPAQVTSFVGRKRELDEVEQLLAESRLLTLTGPGGTGKTRLGLQAAARVSGAFEGGVYFVELAPITDATLVPNAIAQALGIKEIPDEPLFIMLKKHLTDHSTLLVLDNFEHMLDATPLVAELLEAAPDLKVMATSRESLNLYGEQEYPVPPLALPDLSSGRAVPDLSSFGATALFVQRAQAVKPDFQVTDANTNAIADICIRLDGLPLAIELAAARIKLLNPQALLERLEDRLGTLTGGARDMPMRQQTLRSTIEWSYDLLDDAEKTLFARLSVFQGGRTIEAAEAVCSSDLSIDILDGLESLLYKSLIRQTEGPDGEARFVMLETIHEFAHEQLAQSGELETLRQGHAAYFMELVERAGAQHRGMLGSYWLRRLHVEEDNLYAALKHWRSSDQVGRAEMLHRIAQSLWMNGSTNRALETLQEAYALFEELESREEAGAAQRLMSRIYWERGDRETSMQYLRRALEILDDGPPGVELARAYGAMSMMRMLATEHEQAIEWGERALALAEQLDVADVTIHVLNTLGYVYTVLGEAERGLAMQQDSLERAQALELPFDILRGYNNMASSLVGLSRYTDARTAYETALSYSTRLQATAFTGNFLSQLARLAWIMGDWSAALVYRQQLLEFMNTRKSSRFGIGMVWASQKLGKLHNDLGMAQAARDYLEASLPEARGSNELQTTAPHLGELARSYALLDMNAEWTDIKQEFFDWIHGSEHADRDNIICLLHICQHQAAPGTPDTLSDAQATIQRLERHHEQINTPLSDACVNECSGYVALAEESYSQAAGDFSHAVNRWDDIGRPYDRARALNGLGKALLQSDDSEGAHAAYRQAAEIIEMLTAQLEDTDFEASFLASALVQDIQDALAALDNTA